MSCSGEESQGGGNQGNHGRRRLPVGHIRALLSRAKANTWVSDVLAAVTWEEGGLSTWKLSAQLQQCRSIWNACLYLLEVPCCTIRTTYLLPCTAIGNVSTLSPSVMQSMDKAVCCIIGCYDSVHSKPSDHALFGCKVDKAHAVLILWLPGSSRTA